MAVITRDVVLIGKTSAGDRAVNMPVTRLGNIEDSAEIKKNPEEGDYIPIIDSKDGGQMKKFLYTPSESSGESVPHRFYEKNVTYKTGNLTMGVNIISDISEITVNGVKHKTAMGNLRITSFDVSKEMTGTQFIIGCEESCSTVYSLNVSWMMTGRDWIQLQIPFSNITDGDIPFKVGTGSIKKTASGLTGSDFSTVYNYCWPFYFIEKK